MIREQKPKNPDNWLCQMQEDGTCLFSKLIYLGVGAEEWQECDNAFKEKWELDHPIEEYIEEPQEAEVVE
jgi:hypothetical protein